MKLTNRKKILIYILKQNFYGYDFLLKDFSDTLVDLGYATTKNALNVAISSLVADGFLERNQDSHVICLTAAGDARARYLVNYCMSQADWAEIPIGPKPSKNNDINETDGTSSIEDLEAEIAKLKEENKNLKLDLAKMLDIVDSKKEIIDNLGKSLSEVYAKLDKKNKENEYLTDILKTKLDAEKKMVAWTESIIEGNAC